MQLIEELLIKNAFNFFYPNKKKKFKKKLNFCSTSKLCFFPAAMLTCIKFPCYAYTKKYKVLKSFKTSKFHLLQLFVDYYFAVICMELRTLKTAFKYTIDTLFSLPSLLFFTIPLEFLKWHFGLKRS